jgi:hypothetical protein
VITTLKARLLARGLRSAQGSIRHPLSAAVNRPEAAIAVRNSQERNLVWALIEAAKPHMNAGERNYVFVTVGAGDTFAAIRSLIKFVAAKYIPLRPQLVQLCSTWLDGYTFHNEHEHLRRVIDCLPMRIRCNRLQR